MAKILTDRQIGQKTRRLAIQIAEQNWEAPEIILAGINRNGFHFAQLIRAELQAYLPSLHCALAHFQLNPANPLDKEVTCDLPLDSFHDKIVVLVDDVANTGRTLFYAFKPLLGVLPSKVQIAVMVDRKHKTFPVHVDYVGLSLATTFNEHIHVILDTPGERCVILD